MQICLLLVCYIAKSQQLTETPLELIWGSDFQIRDIEARNIQMVKENKF